MLSWVLNFFGGAAFRMIWGEVSSFINAKREHDEEMARMRLQAEMDDAAHKRQMESIRLQHDLGVQTIRVQSEADLDKLAALTFDKGVEQLGQSTGFRWIDAWKSSIQAALATEMMIMIFIHYKNLGWKMDDRAWELAGAALGVFVADRLLFRRGK